MIKRLSVCVCLLAAVSCSKSNSNSSPTTPTIVNVAGRWSGTIQYTQGETLRVDDAVAMTLAQSGSTVTGTWNTTTGVTRQGTVSGSVNTDSFSGNFTYNSTSAGGFACTGSMVVTGTVFSSGNLIWSSPVVVENCTNPPTNVTFNVVKQ
jgi:hypothetical protein